jgi:hypothetical protein
MDTTIAQGWFTLFDKYGATVIGLFVTTVALYLIVRWIGAKVDTMFNMIMSIKQKVSDPAQESIEKITLLNKAIKGLMREAQLDFKADWIHFWQFSNGTRFVGKDRIPYMHISLVYELVGDDCVSVQDEFNQFLLSKVDGIMFTIVNNPLLIERVEPLNVADNPITARMYQLGVTVQDILPVKDADASMIGMFELCWKIPPELSDARKSNLIDYSHRLGIILSTYNEEEK